MRRPCALLACLLGAVLLGSCATSAIIMAPDQPNQPWTPATDANGEIAPGEPPRLDQPPNSTYVLPANKTLASIPPPQVDLERHRPYSLPELIDIAQRENPTTRVAWDDARQAALVAGIAESAFLPLVSAGIVGGWQKTHIENSVLGNTLTNDITAKGNLSVLSIQWLLFDFGERSALLDVAKQGSVISNIAFNAAHQQVIYKVSLAFYAYAAARGRLASTTEALRDAEEVRAAAESKYKQGVGTVVEVVATSWPSNERLCVVVQVFSTMLTWCHWP